MSNTIKLKLKIQATNKLLLDEYKKEVLDIIDEKLSKYKDNLLTEQECVLRVYRKLLKKCDCNKATIDFIKKQIG